MTRYSLTVLAALLAIVAIGCVAVASARPHHGTVTSSNAPRVCFPLRKWGPAPKRYAPCVRITRVYEDGSFSFKVADHDGTVRYTSGVGNLDD